LKLTPFEKIIIFRECNNYSIYTLYIIPMDIAIIPQQQVKALRTISHLFDFSILILLLADYEKEP